MPHEKHIANIRDDELSPEERQQTRFSNARVINELVDPAEIKKRHSQHDLLWSHFGWIPTIMQNWKALLGAFAVAVFIGGQDMISNITRIMESYLP